MIQISEDDFGILAVCAIRYCNSRQTYMPNLVQKICIEHLQEMSDRDLLVMLDDCKLQESMDLYGSSTIDKPRWLKWRAKIEEEIERRNNEK